MPSSFSATIKGTTRSCEIPSKCPICHHIVTIAAPIQINTLPDEVEALLLCPNPDCRRFFIACYRIQPDESVKIVSLRPSKVEIEQIPDSVRTVSPTFVAIYQEAAEANAIGLKQVAGPGFRKAFEFLIKDYAKRKAKPDQRSTIENSFAGEVIKNYVGDARIQAVGKRALWLGNDETHYLRTWKDHDIEDLIKLIRLAINWIEIEKLSEDYTSEMPDA